MFLELLVGYWALKPIAEEIDRFSYEQELIQEEIENLKKSTVARYNSNKSLLIDREQLANIFGINLPMGNRDDLPVDKIELELENEKDPFLKDIQNNKTSFWKRLSEKSVLLGFLRRIGDRISDGLKSTCPRCARSVQNASALMPKAEMFTHAR